MKLTTKKVAVNCLVLMFLMSILIPFLLLVHKNPVLAEASVFPEEQIIPGDIVWEGNESYAFIGSHKASDGYKYDVYRADQLCANSYKVAMGAIIPYDGTNTGMNCPTAGLTREEAVEVGVEVASSIGVSTGVEAFGVSAKIQVETTAALGIATSIGQSYSENVTFTLSPDKHTAGDYAVVTYAFVRKYKVVRYEWVKEQTGTEKHGCDRVPVYKEYWGKEKTTFTTYPESYYYKLEKLS